MLIIYGPLLTVGYGVIFCLCCLLPPLGIPAALGAVGITAGSGIGLYFTVIRDGYTAGARDWDRAHGYYSEIPDVSWPVCEDEDLVSIWVVGADIFS